MDSAQPTNYWDYIRVEELLKLQGGLEGDEAKLTNDEVLFITVHQVFELWFKLMVRELRSMRDIFKAEHVSEQAMSGLVHGVRRVVVILQRCADHFAVVETLVTRDYLDQTALAYRVFRDLWAVRALQIRAEAVPELEHAAFYGFRNG